MNSYLNIDHVSITFPTDNGPLNVLEDISLRVEQGEFISLIGHSGCGKSTVLNIVAGLLNASEGCVLLEDREVKDPGPDRAVVFQNHSLLPWLSVYDNVRLAVDQVFKGTKTRAQRDQWTRHNLELVHMDHALDRKPDEISGGMKQRVGIARALAMEPKVLLMDEPFGALDSLTRTHMQDSLMEIQARLNNTVIMITHDVDEAVLLSDRIVMMTNGPSAEVGQILSVDLPRPRDRLVLADDPRYNHYRAEVLRFLHERHQNPEKETAAAPVAVAANVVAMPAAKPKSRGRVLEKQRLALGFVPLTDCAPLVVAREKGFFAQHGLDAELSRESSWANIRDKVSTGILDGAQMLAPMPLASVLESSRSKPMVTALSLDLNGNAITVSKELYGRMLASGVKGLDKPQGSAMALRRVIEDDIANGRKKMSFAMVFPDSSHNYLLRYWMASAGINPDRDVDLVVVPPPQMGNYLRAGLLSGYCVGEPWNTYAVTEGLGHTLVTSYDIWNNHPEKVLGVTRIWAETNPNTHVALVSALIQACQWLDEPNNRIEAAEILSQGRYVNAPVDVLEKSLAGHLQYSSGQAIRKVDDFNVFHRYTANFPWRSHAVWFLGQMQRWGHAPDDIGVGNITRTVYRSDVYREAAKALGLAVAPDDFKLEGAHDAVWQLDAGDEQLLMGPDSFMDGRAFDPQRLREYVAGFADVPPLSEAIDDTTTQASIA
ncbi:MAG: nitrate ABC transporter ATP-binding protein [Gammaproteobacteria bacterium]|nr:nitrate ABC transporter ATP-binding protein [Gammaproteobacteria bacterium]